jgi:lycopene beta-cyclase
MGGAIKPSTGYGFLNMRVHAQEIAHALKQKSGIPKIQRPYRFRLYDQLLLNILVQQPEQGRPIFQRLFRNQPIQRILKFLDERTHILEEAKIFTPLPAGIFLDQLFKEWRLK